MVFPGLQVTADGFRLAITRDAWSAEKQITFDVEPEHFDRGRYVHFVEQRSAGTVLEPAYWYVADSAGKQVG